MQRIYYATGSILTGDAIAAAVLAYAEALAKSPLADTIHIPFVQEQTGEREVATLLIGPASQLMFVPEPDGEHAEPVDGELVEELERRALVIGSPRPIAQDIDAAVMVSEDYE
jgi:hypothetical protein